MKYFSTEVERQGTCYYEFQKGKWSERFWKEDSLLMYDDICCELRFNKFIKSVIPEYDSYGITEVSRKQWQEILKKAEAYGGEIYEAVCEADEWAKEIFDTDECFTIVGL